jgi:hypothetical protein
MMAIPKCRNSALFVKSNFSCPGMKAMHELERRQYIKEKAPDNLRSFFFYASAT